MPAISQTNFKPSLEREVPVNLAFEPQREIARLAALHDEAKETALLANLLGRAPFAAAALALCTVPVAWVGLRAMPMPEVATWTVLVLIGLGAIVRTYVQAMAMPFERASLRAFAGDLTAIMTYCGFAWSAGAYLALDSGAPPLLLATFAAVPCLLIAAALRQREAAIVFTIPVATLSAFAAVLRPLPEGPLAAAFVLIACAGVSGAIFWIAGRNVPAQGTKNITELALS